MEKKSKDCKYTFILKNINISNIEEKYDIISLKSDINSKENKNITKLSDLTTNNNTFFSYLDEAKKEHRCLYEWVSKNVREIHSLSNQGSD